jgi:hypothetical protein
VTITRLFANPKSIPNPHDHVIKLLIKPYMVLN